jgi:fluoroquinolone transport system permease protein
LPALSKFGGIAGWTVLISWFVPEPWQWLIGIFPTFLVSKAYWMALAGRPLWWLPLVAAVILQLGLIYMMLRRFQTVAYR